MSKKDFIGFLLWGILFIIMGLFIIYVAFDVFDLKYTFQFFGFLIFVIFGVFDIAIGTFAIVGVIQEKREKGGKET